jgi:hypothetical protein
MNLPVITVDYVIERIMEDFRSETYQTLDQVNPYIFVKATAHAL